MRFHSTMVYGKQVPVLTYDKDYIHNNEEKDTVSLFLYPSTHKLLNVFKTLWGFPTIDDALVSAILGYNMAHRNTESSATIPYYSGDEQVIAIAGDESRRMNRKKRKKGKSLLPERSEAFKTENLTFEDGS